MSELEALKAIYNHRWALNQGDTQAKETPEFWSSKAEGFAAKAHATDSRRDIESFLSRFEWSDDMSVLDVGAGPGTYAIPLAKRVKKVTATDFSAEMLEQLHLQASKEKVTNIKTSEGRWLALDIKQKFHTVLCLNSLGVISVDEQHQTKLKETLIKLRDCTQKRLFILIPHADSHLPPALRESFGLPVVSIERRRIAMLYYAMVDCQMLPELRLLERPFSWVFSSNEEAAKTLLSKAGLEATAENMAKLKDYLTENLKPDANGNLMLVHNSLQGLYTWHK